MSSSSSDSRGGTKKLTAVFIIGIILALAGIVGVGLTPFGESVVGWAVVSGVGFVLVSGGIIYVTAAIGSGHR